MPKKKKPKKPRHHKLKHKARHHPHLAFDHEPTGHHARLRKHHHAAGGHHSVGTSHAVGHHRKTRKKASKRAAPAHKRSALMKRLHAAAAGAREQLRTFGRRHKHHQPEKTVTEQTLRNQMALKCVRRCSH